MPECGIAPKALIEGPPRPACADLLLRQTSFKALEEPVMLPGSIAAPIRPALAK